MHVKLLPLDALLEQSDVVSIHTPLTDETKGIINARALGLMKSSAIVVNTSRGPVIDEPALIEALQNNRIAGAGLDVFTTEPLETDSPLLFLDNVVLTSHVAGVTLANWSRRIAFGFANIQRVADGQKPASVIGGEKREKVFIPDYGTSFSTGSLYYSRGLLELCGADNATLETGSYPCWC